MLPSIDETHQELLHRLTSLFFSSLTTPRFSLVSWQVAVKNNIDVFYFSVLIPLNIFFVEDGKMGKYTTHDFIEQHPFITSSQMKLKV